MGFGRDRFGAYPLAVLGLAPVLDAPPGRARTAIQPLDRPQPTLLRLRTARQDWFVDSRIRGALRYESSARLPAGVGISRVPARYAPGERGYPYTQRIPATDPQAGCQGPPRASPGRSSGPAEASPSAARSRCACCAAAGRCASRQPGSTARDHRGRLTRDGVPALRRRSRARARPSRRRERRRRCPGGDRPRRDGHTDRRRRRAGARRRPARQRPGSRAARRGRRGACVAGRCRGQRVGARPGRRGGGGDRSAASITSSPALGSAPAGAAGSRPARA